MCRETKQFGLHPSRHVSRRPELPGGHGGFPRQDLARLSAPTLVVAAEHDVFWPGREAAAAAEAALPKVTTRVIPGARHLPAKHKVAVANDWILAWLEQRGLLS
jgi:pimeloyl-ACP methyl ester carboxylesterase